MGEPRGDFLCRPLITEVNHMVLLSSSRPVFLRHQHASPKRGPMAGSVSITWELVSADQAAGTLCTAASVFTRCSGDPRAH